MTSHVADAEWRAKLDERLDELYVLKDETFGVAPHQKAADIATLGAHVLAELDAACGGSDTSDFGNRHRRAAWMQYARGKTLNALTETHSSEAEQLLTAAVKLDPANVDAWIVLGECALKRQDIAAAESCFAEALVFAEVHDAVLLTNFLDVIMYFTGECKIFCLRCVHCAGTRRECSSTSIHGVSIAPRRAQRTRCLGASIDAARAACRRSGHQRRTLLVCTWQCIPGLIFLSCVCARPPTSCTRGIR